MLRRVLAIVVLCLGVPALHAQAPKGDAPPNPALGMVQNAPSLSQPVSYPQTAVSSAMHRSIAPAKSSSITHSMIAPTVQAQTYYAAPGQHVLSQQTGAFISGPQFASPSVQSGYPVQLGGVIMSGVVDPQAC